MYDENRMYDSKISPVLFLMFGGGAGIVNAGCSNCFSLVDHAKAPPKKAACSFTEYGCCWDMKTEVRPDRNCPGKNGLFTSRSHFFHFIFSSFSLTQFLAC